MTASFMRKLAAIPMLVRQHAEDAAFLFEQRAKAFHAHSWNDVTLGRCDQRLAANIAGLIAAGETGAELAREGAEKEGGAGEVFAFAATAFAQDDLVDEVLALGLATPQGRHGLSGALAWSDAAVIGPHVRDWLTSNEPGLRLLAMMTLSHHRRDPGTALAPFLADTAPEVRSRAARLAFEMGRTDLVGPLTDLAEADANDPWPHLALVRFGAKPAELFAYVTSPDRPKAGLVLDLALLAAPDRAREALSKLMAQPDTRPLALSRLGVVSDRSIVEWLLKRMQDENDAEATVFAFLDLFPVDPDECGKFLVDPDRFGDATEVQAPALRPRDEDMEAWLRTLPAAPPHRSLRLQMLEALRTGLQDRQAPLPNWRKTRVFPAWS